MRCQMLFLLFPEFRSKQVPWNHHQWWGYFGTLHEFCFGEDSRLINKAGNFLKKRLKPETILFMLPESFGRDLCSPDQGSQLRIGDIRIDGSEPGEGRETTVRASNHSFPSDDIGKTADAFCYQFGMFDKIGG